MFEDVQGGAAAAEPASGVGPAEWVVPGVDRPVLPSPEVLAVQAAIAGLAALDPAGLPDRQVLLDARLLLQALERAQRLVLPWLAQVEQRRLHRADGAGSTARWVQQQGLEPDRRQLAVARRHGQFGQVDAALADGRLDTGQAQAVQLLLARLQPLLTDEGNALLDGQPADAAVRAVILDGVPMLVAEARGGFPSPQDPVLTALRAELAGVARGPGRLLDRLERALLLLAGHVEPGQLRGALGVLADTLLPQAHATRAEQSRCGRFLRLVRTGDSWQLTGQLDLQCGERLFTVLQQQLGADPDSPLDTARAEQLRAQGLDPYDSELGSTLTPRTIGQRRHDALDAALGRYLAAGLGGSRDGSPVQLLVTVPAATLDGHPGSLVARAGSGAPLPTALVRRWACGSALTRQVLDLAGRVLAVSHTRRTLTGPERRALRTQTGGHCQGAGCPRGLHQLGTVLHPHHATPWAVSGTTSLTDTIHLCQSCHHDIHDGQQILKLKNGRRLGPDGWVDDS